jgi:uncharacterized protein (DUF3820 family)
LPFKKSAYQLQHLPQFELWRWQVSKKMPSTKIGYLISLILSLKYGNFEG